MIPQLVLITVAALAATIGKLVAAGGDKAAAEEALLEGAETIKRSLDYMKFGMPTDTDKPA